MITAKYQSDMSNIREKIKTFLKQDKDVVFSATFVTGKTKERLIDHAQIKQLSLVSKNLKCDNPDRIRVDLHDGKDNADVLWFKDIFLKELQEETASETTASRGLGEAEINQIVDERFREKQRAVEFEQFKQQNYELLNENQELQDNIDELETENARLESELENKKQVRYYAGMLGDILESFGIAKDKLKKPLVELMGIEDGEKKSKQLSSAKEDSSGIVEEKTTTQENQLSSEEQKRNEIITLISDYLKTTSNQTLANIFTIFSDIEKDNAVAEQIIQFLNSKKQAQS